MRTAFLLGLGILVLPTDAATQAKFADGARTVFAWSVTFCDRNGATCEKGREAWGVFVKKAEFGAKMAYELISERAKLAQTAGPQPVQQTVAPQSKPQPSQNTLKPEDLQPAWRGKKVASAGG